MDHGHPHAHEHEPKKPHKQEQETAQREITELAPNVLRMQLPISMPGLGHVNMYALIDERGAAVIDPGLPTPSNWKAILDRLAQAGLKPKHVHTVIVTHSHPDHFGGAARLARESGAAVVAHRSFRFGVIEATQDPEVSVDDLAASGENDEAHQRVLTGWNHRTPWGGQHPRPPLKMRLRWRLARWLGSSFVPAITKPVRAGEVLRAGGREWVIRHTPGHTEDHICLHDPAGGLFLSGDHVLPSITPHISGLTLSKDPLDTFFDSLDQAAAVPDVKLVLPAHGHPFTDLAGRCRAIKEHHYDRLDTVKRIGRELGPATVQAFSQKLFKPRSWGEMAESETYAHLEHLRIAGAAEVHRDPEGFLLYQTG
jgi:glyoxylase-like metal-dependent hydrolase (beta-lactamase superfamily II)